MSNNFILYSLANKYYYEKVENRKNSDEFYDIVKVYLPNDWSIKKSSIFFSCNKRNNILPGQGWKIHISADLTNSKQILDIVSKIAVENNVAFKFMVDTEILKLTSQKIYSRNSSGKFITIYPKDTDSFLELLDILYSELKEFEGPYILSDKRYKDCKVLYYRYGGFIGKFRVEKNGDLIPTIMDNNGLRIDDNRIPYFKLPFDIENPVKEWKEAENESYLKKNYRINHPIRFSNSGGVYEATKLNDNSKVIIKEARPYTCLIDGNKESVYFRKKEFEFLQILENSKMTPKPIEIFKDWEHTFLVEEFLEGITLQSYCAENNPFYKTFVDSVHIDAYIKDLIKIFIQIVDFLIIVHSKGLIFSDLSPNNIMITETLEVRFIDFEACIKISDKDYVQMATKGFSEKIENGKLIESDLYSLGCVCFSCLLRRNEMIPIEQHVIKRFLDCLFKDYLLPNDLKDIIFDLTQKEIEKRPKLTEIKNRLNNLKTIELLCSKNDIKNNYDELNLKYVKTINECLIAIDKTSDIDRTDRLFPNTPLVNNALNITCGALGNIYTFNWLKQENMVRKYMSCISKNINNLELYPPGLYVGLAGIAWVLLEIGLEEKAIDILKTCEKSQLFKNNYGIQCGLSGYGLTLLKFWMKTNNKEFLAKAVTIAEELISNAKIDNTNDFVYWSEENKTINIGYGNGASGISLFLLYVYLATNEEKYLNVGKLALKYDLSQKRKVSKSDFYSFPINNVQINTLYPYFIEGNAGILSVLLRYYKVTKKDYYLEEIHNILPGVYVKYAVNPGLFMGLAGLGNVLLDCYQFTDEIVYKNMAYDVAEGIDLYKVISPDGVLFPGNFITKLSTDFGSGTSGILLFLHRLVSNETNFCFFLDDLIVNSIKEYISEVQNDERNY